MGSLIDARALTKTYGEVTALNALDLQAESGQVLAILGPNGAGKTTLVRSLATLATSTSGSLRIAGIDVQREPQRVRRTIGLAGQYAAVEPAMTGRENLRMVARLFGHSSRGARHAADAVLEQLGLTDAGDRLVRGYSGGMRRRLDLGSSLVGGPKVLILDEPTTGLDPRSRNELWRAIESLVQQGTDVILTTQYLDEADQLADRIAIIDRGALVAEGTASELKSRAGSDVVDVHLPDADDLRRASDLLGPTAVTDDRRGRLSVPAVTGADEVVRVIQTLSTEGIAVADIALRRPTLDDVFLALTGHATDTTPEEVAA